MGFFLDLEIGVTSSFCACWGSACNTSHDEGGRSSARSINCHSIILECSFFRIAGRPSPTQTFCCLSALSELGSSSSSNGLLLLGRLDKGVANDHVGVGGKVELIGGSGGNIDQTVLASEVDIQIVSP